MNRTTRRRFLAALVAAGLLPIESLAQTSGQSKQLKTYLAKHDWDKGYWSCDVSFSTKGKGQDAITHLKKGLGNLGVCTSWKDMKLAEGVTWRGKAIEGIKQDMARSKAIGKDDWYSRQSFNPRFNFTYDIHPAVVGGKVTDFNLEMQYLKFSMIQILVDNKPLQWAKIKLVDDKGILAMGNMKLPDNKPDDDTEGGHFRGELHHYTEYADRKIYHNSIFKNPQRWQDMLKAGKVKVVITTTDDREVATLDMPLKSVTWCQNKLKELSQLAVDDLVAGRGKYVPNINIGDVQCFMTSATCDVLGLGDGCWELNSMRSFRDHHLAHMPGGEAQIKAYYQHAPAIAQRLMSTDSGRKELLKIYYAIILPCAILTRIGAQQTCRNLYTRMVDRLLNSV